jgi:hypothetical protein
LYLLGDHDEGAEYDDDDDENSDEEGLFIISNEI